MYCTNSYQYYTNNLCHYSPLGKTDITTINMHNMSFAHFLKHLFSLFCSFHCFGQSVFSWSDIANVKIILIVRITCQYSSD